MLAWFDLWNDQTWQGNTNVYREASF